MDQVTLVEKKGANYVILEVAGTINSYTFTDFQSKVYALVKNTNLVLDLSETNKIDSSGIGVILAAYNDAEEHNYKVYIMRPSSAARKAIESTGFLDMFPVIQSVTEVV